MFPFIVVFALNIVCAYMADKSFYRSKIACFLWLAMIVLTCTVVYGLRDIGVGTDTTIYTESYFQEASFIHDWAALKEAGEGIDKGYLLLSILATKLGSSAQSLLIANSLFTLTFFMLGLYNFKKALGIKMWIYMVFFCCLLSGPMLNYMRQFCAMSLLFYGFSLFLQKKWMPYIILQVAAFFFHSSSVFFICVPMIYFISNIKDVRKRNLLTMGGFIMLAIMMGYYFYFLTLVGNLGFVKELYTDRYGADGSNVATQSFILGKSIFVYWFITLAIIFIGNKQKALDKRLIYIIFVMFVASTVLQQLQFIVRHMHRMSLYIAIVYYAYLTLLYQSKKVPLPFKFLGYLLFIYQWYKMTIGGANEVYPFTSKILGIG